MGIKKILGLTFLLLTLVGAPAWAAKVDVNKADAATLMSNLNGIGPVKAKAIIAYRKKNGSFKTLEDLMKVPGIGEGIVSKNRANLSLKGGLSKSSAKKPAAAPKASAKAGKDAKPAAKAKKAAAPKVDKAKKAVDPKKAKADKVKKAKAAKADKAKKAKAAKAAKAKKAKAKKDKKDKK